jgi:hypothetical protein
MLRDSVISSIARVVLGSIELLPILPNKTIGSKEKMSEKPNIIHYRINRGSHSTKGSQTKIESVPRENLI